MTKRKPGRPPKLPIESPHWIPYETALTQATARFGSKELAIAKLEAALASGTIRCKVEQIDETPKLTKRADLVAMVYLPEDFRDPQDPHPFLAINRQQQPGWLFLWDFDRLKYFNDSTEEAAATPVKTQKTAAAVGRPTVHDWIKITLLAVQLRRNYRAIKPTPLIEKLQKRLQDEGINPPVLSEFQKLTDQMWAFDNSS